jgi:hypothetical protein
MFACECCGQPAKGGPPARRMGEGLTTPYHKKKTCCEMMHKISGLAGPCEHGNGTSGSIKSGEFLD